MSSTIEQDIKDSISKNLPAQVGDVLKTRLEQAEKDAKAIIKLNEELKTKKELLDELSNINSDLNAKLHLHKLLDEREKTLEKREIRYEVELLKKDIECQKLIAANTIAMMATVFRNPTYQESHFKNNMVPVTQNGYTSTIQTSESDTVTKQVS